jgi:hypothetical protein
MKEQRKGIHELRTLKKSSGELTTLQAVEQERKKDKLPKGQEKRQRGNRSQMAPVPMTGARQCHQPSTTWLPLEGIGPKLGGELREQLVISKRILLLPIRSSYQGPCFCDYHSFHS